MSEIRKDKCDFCGKETQDRYIEEGWIHLEGIESISILRGRKEDGTAIIDCGNFVEEVLDFCSEKCLIGFLKQMGSKEERNEI